MAESKQPLYYVPFCHFRTRQSAPRQPVEVEAEAVADLRVPVAAAGLADVLAVLLVRREQSVLGLDPRLEGPVLPRPGPPVSVRSSSHAAGGRACARSSQPWFSRSFRALGRSFCMRTTSVPKRAEELPEGVPDGLRDDDRL